MGFRIENCASSTYIATLENGDQPNLNDITVAYLVVFSPLWQRVIFNNPLKTAKT